MGNTSVWNDAGIKDVTSIAPGPARLAAVMQPQQTERMTTEKTANCGVVDNSSSTGQNTSNEDKRQKIEAIKEAASSFCINLPKSAYLSIIVFNHNVSVLYPMSQLNDKLSVIRNIQQLSPSGSTAMRDALAAAGSQLNHAPSGYLKRVYLLTDGIPDNGQDPTTAAESIRNIGGQLQTIGFGAESHIDEELLKRISTVGADGQAMYSHFCDAQKMTAFFKRESTLISQ